MCLELLGIGIGMNFGVLFLSLWYLPLVSTKVSTLLYFLNKGGIYL